MSRADIDLVLPSGEDALQAEEVRRALEKLDANDMALRVQVNDAPPVDLPPIVAKLLLNILKETAAGHAVTLVPIGSEVTTQQAAELLNVSRPFLVGMIDEGTLPSHMVGDQCRLQLQDILTYKADNRAKRRDTLRDMAAIDQQLGLI